MQNNLNPADMATGDQYQQLRAGGRDFSGPFFWRFETKTPSSTFPLLLSEFQQLDLLISTEVHKLLLSFLALIL